MADLLFGAPAAQDADLVFGQTGETSNSGVSVYAIIPMVVQVEVGFRTEVAVQAVIPLEVHVNARYVSGAARPLVAKANTGWQVGVAASVALRHQHTAALATRASLGAAWQQGTRHVAGAAVQNAAGTPYQASTSVRHQQAEPRRASAEVVQDQAVPRRSSTVGRWQQGVGRRAATSVHHQDTLHLRNRTAGRWQQAVPKSHSYREGVGPGLPLRASIGGRYQQAMKAPAGIWNGVVPPTGEPCYTPSGHLVFQDLPGTPHLVFVCDNHGGDGPGEPQVVVPIRKVYVVLNNVWLRKVEGNVMLPATAMSLSLDRDSWTWNFSASLPPQALADVSRNGDGEPVEVEAFINGVAYRFLIESVRRQRQFGRAEIGVSGRGKSALLDQEVMSFANASAMTAQQLMADVLTLNGVSIGWDLDFNLVDWNVPAGAFSHQGTYISAINAIANAAGGYVQPAPVDQVLRILPDYPDAPWAWPVTANYELPADLMTVESLEWVERPRYNRVYVRGTGAGPMGRVTRGGTAGEVEAPMVVDPLLADEPAQRQRGISVLGNTGQIAMMGLRLPVLPETGIIVPGRYVKYVDGGVERFGITRGVRVDVGRPEVWQQIEVETHG